MLIVQCHVHEGFKVVHVYVHQLLLLNYFNVLIVRQLQCIPLPSLIPPAYLIFEYTLGPALDK